MKVPRLALNGMPAVAILADEQRVMNDPDYPGAKAGDAMAASRMVDRFINPRVIEQIRLLVDGRKPILLPVHAVEIARNPR